MRPHVVIALVVLSLCTSLGALADSLTAPPPSPKNARAVETLEVASKSSGRITVTSRDGKHTLDCDVLRIDVLADGTSQLHARGTVKMRTGEQTLTAAALRLEISAGEWKVSSEAAKLEP